MTNPKLTVIEYPVEDSDTVRKILGDNLDEGWSYQNKDIVVTEVMLSGLEMAELMDAGVKINTLLPDVETVVLRTLMTTFAHSGLCAIVRDSETISIEGQEDEILGQVVVKEDDVSFLYKGNPVDIEGDTIKEQVKNFLGLIIVKKKSLYMS